MDADTKTPPGSNQAREAGCKCPVMDNCNGLGRGGDGPKFGWVMNHDCPLHGACGECLTVGGEHKLSCSVVPR